MIIVFGFVVNVTERIFTSNLYAYTSEPYPTEYRSRERAGVRALVFPIYSAPCSSDLLPLSSATSASFVHRRLLASMFRFVNPLLRKQMLSKFNQKQCGLTPHCLHCDFYQIAFPILYHALIISVTRHARLRPEIHRFKRLRQFIHPLLAACRKCEMRPSGHILCRSFINAAFFISSSLHPESNERKYDLKSFSHYDKGHLAPKYVS